MTSYQFMIPGYLIRLLHISYPCSGTNKLQIIRVSNYSTYSADHNHTNHNHFTDSSSSFSFSLFLLSPSFPSPSFPLPTFFFFSLPTFSSSFFFLLPSQPLPQPLLSFSRSSLSVPSSLSGFRFRIPIRKIPLKHDLAAKSL